MNDYGKERSKLHADPRDESSTPIATFGAIVNTLIGNAESHGDDNKR